MLDYNHYRCPICGHQTLYDKDVLEGYILCEEEIDCPICKYHYQFAYGNYQEIIGNKLFIWDYKESETKSVQRNKKIRSAILIARRRWRKYHKENKIKGDLNNE